MTSDRNIDISQMEEEEMDNIYNMQNDIGIPQTLLDERFEDQSDWMEKDEANPEQNSGRTEEDEATQNIYMKKNQSETNQHSMMQRPQEMTRSQKT